LNSRKNSILQNERQTLMIRWFKEEQHDEFSFFRFYNG
jgi:hypothetical protein